MMARATVPDAMAEAFASAAGRPLGERILDALDAAEAEGGDVRGRQSAALLIAPAQGEPWRRLFDLRVDDHDDPLAELRRLHTLQRAYETTEEAEALTAAGRHDDAAPLYERAAELAPESDELLFWAGLGAAQGGDMATGLERVRAAAAISPRWLELLDRLEPEIAPSAADVRARLRGQVS
jgi:tetratricopeptide (TPR) repeat protein